MTRGQIILLAGAVGAVVFLYLWMPTTAKKQDKAAAIARNKDQSDAASFNWDTYRARQISLLPENSRQLIADGAAHLITSDSLAKKEILLEQYRVFVENNLPLLAADATEQIARIDQLPERWNLAGQWYRVSAMTTSEDHALIAYAWSNAIACFQKAVTLAPDSLDYQIHLASALVEQGNQTMEGVKMLLTIVEQHPDNIPANLILGKFGIVSGQYEKAVVRLEKVVKLDPKNSEAYFYLAEAYHGLGRIEDAIKTFEMCKKLVDDPGFSAEIDQYILKIKNS